MNEKKEAKSINLLENSGNLSEHSNMCYDV